jgi:hypothetical protein
VVREADVKSASVLAESCESVSAFVELTGERREVRWVAYARRSSDAIHPHVDLVEVVEDRVQVPIETDRCGSDCHRRASWLLSAGRRRP